MRVVVVNGAAGVGKDSFVHLCTGATTALVGNVSSVDNVKTAAMILGWDGEKDETGRQALSDLKDISTRTWDGPLRYMLAKVESYEMRGYGFCFLHIREPKEIVRLKEAIPRAETVLIRRSGVQSFSNHSDQNVDGYTYDHVIDNDGSLEELEAAAEAFVGKEVILGIQMDQEGLEPMVECCRCRNKHPLKDRVQVPSTSPIFKGLVAYDEVCPRCKGRNYYKLDKNGKRAKA